ncbi:MAG TPA: SIS domain-containing protein [Clostridia bacterium]|nr:SIS domain-containing protein [Clostridia bacterium]
MNSDVKQILSELIERYPVLKREEQNIIDAFELICDSYDNSGKVLVCGNGGSAADSEHIVGELMKGFLSKRELNDNEKKMFEGIENADYITANLQGSMPAISLTSQTSLLTAFSNDVAPDMIFAQQVWGYSKNTLDSLIALSTSGNSKNVVNAVKVASALGINSIGITGNSESELSRLCTACVLIPETETFKVQEITLPIYHAICAMIEKTYFNKGV